MAINATNRVHQCVFYPLSYWIHGGAAGDEYIWLFPTSAAMLDHPTRHAPPHMSCGRRWRTGRASGPYSSRRPRGWSALILYGRYGLIGRLSVSPIQIVWGFPPYVLYGQTSAYFQKWTGGGKTTLISDVFYVDFYFATGRKRSALPGRLSGQWPVAVVPAAEKRIAGRRMANFRWGAGAAPRPWMRYIAVPRGDRKSVV